MKAIELMKLWSGSVKHPCKEFSLVEERLGFILPADYKELLEVFGFGEFGELCLFYPEATLEWINLPAGVFRAHKLLNESEAFTRFQCSQTPDWSFSVLGVLSSRTYLISKQSMRSWQIFDSESLRVFDVGENLITFLYSAYSAWLAPTRLELSEAAV